MSKSSCLSPALGVTKFIIGRDMILITLLHHLSRTWMFNKPNVEAGLLNKSSCLSPALGATKFRNARDMILVILCCVA